MTSNDDDTFVKKDVEFPAAGCDEVLAGTVYWPKKTNIGMDSNNGNDASNEPTVKEKVPAAIIIHGSGPIDRDGNVAGGLLLNIRLNTHNRLAEALVTSTAATAGMAVLCYDKRGIGKSISATNRNWYYEAGMMDLVHDAVEGYRYLVQQDDEIDTSKIFLFGHSEGAILLPRIAEVIAKDMALPKPRGLILLSGFGEALDEAAGNQRARLLKETAEEKGLQGWILRKVMTKEKLEKQYNDFLEQMKNEDQAFAPQYCGLVKTPTKWYREHMAWDAHGSLESCTLPCLAITGDKDIQVKPEYCEPETAQRLAPSAASLETHIIQNMTHILRSVDGPPSLIKAQKEYPKQGQQPLNAELLQIIHKWLAGRLKE